MNPARVEVEGALRGGILEVLVDDPGDRYRRLPLAALLADVRPGMAVDEGKLSALEKDAAIGVGEAAAFGAVRNDVPDGKLAGKRFALRFEIDAGGKALELATARLGAAQLRHQSGKVGLGVDRRRIGLILCLLVTRQRNRKLVGLAQKLLSDVGSGDGRCDRDDLIAGRTDLSRCNRAGAHRSADKQRRTETTDHIVRL